MAYKCPDCNTYFYGDFCPKCAKSAADCIEMSELEIEEDKKAAKKKEKAGGEGQAVCPKCGRVFEGLFCPFCGYGAEEAGIERLEDEEVAAQEEAFRQEDKRAEEEKKREEQEQAAAAAAAEKAEEEAVASGEKTKCPKCGKVVEGTFCPDCGTQVQQQNKCPHCGTERAKDAKFCPVCGYDYVNNTFAKQYYAFKRERRENAGKIVKQKFSAAVSSAKVHKKRVITAVLAIAVILAIVVPVSVVFTSPVQPANVDRINIGDTQAHVVSVFGDPYNYKKGDTTFTYYSDNYLNIRKQLDEIADMDDIGSFSDLADAIEKEEELNQKLETLEYKRTTVTFDEGGLVTQIVYNASIIENESRNKQLESHYMATNEIVARQENKVSYTLKYTDGSICKRVARIIPVESETDTEYPFPYEFDVTDPFSETGEKVTFECTVTKGSVGVSVELDASGTLTVYGSGTVGASDLNGISGNINSVIIGGGITEIAGGTFSQLSQIKSVSIGDSVKSIGSYAFNKCINLSSVTIPDSVKEIGTGAFAGCTGLVKVYLPSDVAKYGTRIFYDCNNLQEIHIGDIVDWLAFLSFGKGEQINNADYSVYINGAIPEEIVVPDVILSIPTNAFRNFSRVTDITISSNVRYMGNNLFYDCSNLTNITYEGTMEQWEKIDKTSEWAGNSTDFTITCTDGVLDKSGNQI